MTTEAIWSSVTAIVLLWLASLVKKGHAASLGNESDRLALLSFKAMVTDDPYETLSSWNDSLHFCEWQGVTCEQQRVTKLDLHARRLVGSISSSIANLTFLNWISIADNGFHGEIPNEIGQLSYLSHINLSINSLEFQIPANLTMLSHLQQLDLSFNKLVGGIPDQLSSCEELVHLDLSSNNLRGSIPPSLGNLSSLDILILRKNNLEGSIPQDLGRLEQLSRLLLEANKLSGTVPSSIYNLSSLVFLGLTENNLQGSLPPDFGITLPQLRFLSAGGNSFTGPLPSTLVNASFLIVLDIANNSFTGQLPKNLGSLADLSNLRVGTNNLESNDLDFLTSLTNCTNLQYLIIGHNHFRGLLPESIANLSTKLTILGLGDNEIQGFIPSGISNLASLLLFESQKNLLDGNIPSTIGLLENLQLLRLESNMLSGSIPTSIGNLSRLYSLDLHNNRLTGIIPRSIGDSQSLQLLSLAQNNLSGEIPKPLPLNLRVFNVSYNSFFGPLPMATEGMVSLIALDVSENQISGEIPNAISSSVMLLYLNLAGNNFQGTIPSSLSSLKDVRAIDLSRNQLKGHIPHVLANLPSLIYLNLSFNDFGGDLPNHGLYTNTSVFFVQGNSNLCGGAPQLKLPPCPKTQVSAKRKKFSTSLVVLAACSFVLPLTLLLSVAAFCHARKSKNRIPPATITTTVITDGYWRLRVTYEEIHKATGGFSDANLVGSGSYGSVYKGNLSGEETPIAVKVLNLQRPNAFKTFAAECEALRMIRHRNVVKILTCCSRIDYKGNYFLALVLEFVSNGSLEEWLHQRNLSIFERLNIAIDAASALDYLHNHCLNPVLHCDLKPSNILLDDNMSARISDFGLARILTSGTYETSSLCVKGTVGYAPPEYGLLGKASASGDVYSYGIILLELFTGRRPTDGIFSVDCDLHNFVKIGLPERVKEILDPALLLVEDVGTGINSEMMLECLVWILKIGISCSSSSPRDRMEIKFVTKELEKIRAMLNYDQSKYSQTKKPVKLNNF